MASDGGSESYRTNSEGWRNMRRRASA